MWKTRTRTKIVIIALLWIGILITFLVVGLPLLGLKYKQLIAYRENISAIIIALTTGGAGMFVINAISIAKENTKSPNNEVKEG